MMRELSSGTPLSHPVLRGQGWWRRPGRFLCQPVATPDAITSITADGHVQVPGDVRPILITGATGTLGRAFALACHRRRIAYRLLSRQDMDIGDPDAIERALAHYRPWAVINTAGYVRVDDAENDGERERCMRENADGAAHLAAACARHGVHLTTFSSDLVFDGAKDEPYVETDAAAPLNVYGRSKAEAERVLDAHPGALVVRTSAFFGPWDRHNFVTLALQALERGETFRAASDLTVSPTYVPDLGAHLPSPSTPKRASGTWPTRAPSPGPNWRKAADAAGIDAASLQALPAAELGMAAPRPRYAAMTSARGVVLPPLDNAIARYSRTAQPARSGDGRTGPHGREPPAAGERASAAGTDAGGGDQGTVLT